MNYICAGYACWSQFKFVNLLGGHFALLSCHPTVFLILLSVIVERLSVRHLIVQAWHALVGS